LATQCPICAQEVDSAEDLWRHTTIEHPEATAGSAPPPTEQLEPGWYPDPWNPGQQRWFSGGDWSGRTAPAGSTPADPRREETAAYEPPTTAEELRPAAAPAEEPSPWERKPPTGPTFAKDRTVPIVLVVGVVIAIVAVAAVVLLSGSGSPKGQSSGGIAQPVTVAPTVHGLAAGLLVAADLGPGWTPHPGAHAMKPAEFKAGPCGSTLWQSDIGGWQASFINGAAVGASRGAVINEVREAPSPTVIGQQQAYIASPAFLPCLRQEAAGKASSLVGPGSRVGAINVQPLALTLPATTQASMSSRAEILTIPVTASNSTSQVITDEHVQLFYGPYEATLDVTWSSLAPLTSEIVQLQADALATRVSGLPADGVSPT
jgi:uncharacterized protein DUF2510